jgi:lipopolysaccharide export LptBFGC system permease protein LptF
MNPESSVTLLTAFLIPSILALGLPAGLAMSIAAMRGRALSRRVCVAVILIAVAASVGSFVNVAWVIPPANQAYREEMAGRHVPRGQNELTLTELSAARGGSFMLHARVALAAAPLTFAVFGLIAATRRRFHRVAAVGVAAAGVVGYVLLMFVGESLSRDGLVPPPFAAWAPQLLLVAATSLIVIGADSDKTLVTRTPA